MLENIGKSSKVKPTVLNKSLARNRTTLIQVIVSTTEPVLSREMLQRLMPACFTVQAQSSTSRINVSWYDMI